MLIMCLPPHTCEFLIRVHPQVAIVPVRPPLHWIRALYPVGNCVRSDCDLNPGGKYCVMRSIKEICSLQIVRIYTPTMSTECSKMIVNVSAIYVPKSRIGNRVLHLNISTSDICSKQFELYFISVIILIFQFLAIYYFVSFLER